MVQHRLAEMRDWGWPKPMSLQKHKDMIRRELESEARLVAQHMKNTSHLSGKAQPLEPLTLQWGGRHLHVPSDSSYL